MNRLGVIRQYFKLKFIIVLIQSSNYILNRSEKLMDAAEMIRGENPDICAGLKELAEQHQENLPNYLEAEG